MLKTAPRAQDDKEYGPPVGGQWCGISRRATGHEIAQYLWGEKNPPDGGFCRQTISRILFCPGPVVSNQPRVASIISLHNVLPQNVKPSTRSRVWDPQLGTYLRLLRIEIARFTRYFSIDSSLLL